MAADEPEDDLLKRAREVGSKAGEHGDSKPDTDGPVLGPINRRTAEVRRRLGPIGAALAWIFRIVARWFRWAAFQPPDESAPGASEPKFSPIRLLRSVAISGAVLLALHVAWSAIYFYSTYFEETVYVTGKQEIVTGELYQFGGCTSLPCSTEADNGKFYLIESSLYFPIMYYPEEEVFANIPLQNAACNVEGYGIYFRTLRWIYKTLQLYQHVVDVSCRPYTEDEIRQAVDEGEIVRDAPPPQ